MKIKQFIAQLKKRVIVLYYAGSSPDLPVSAKLLIVVTLAYALSPIDLIPDFIPLLGYLDDLIILPLLITLSCKAIPPHILEEAKTRADEEPVTLARRWGAAAVIISFWAAVIIALAYHALRR